MVRNHREAKMRFSPKGDRLLILPEPIEETTKGGIIIPDAAKNRPQVGKVVAVGDGAWHDGKKQPVAYKAGDNVLYGRYVGTDIEIDGTEYIIMNADDVFGILEVYEDPDGIPA